MNFEPPGTLVYYDHTLPSIIAHMIIMLHPDMGPKVQETYHGGRTYWCKKDDVGWTGDSNRCWICQRYSGRVTSFRIHS